MTFLNNNAGNHGGALKVATESLASDVNFQRLYNRCFFQYSNDSSPPEDWNVSKVFLNDSQSGFMHESLPW